MQRPSGAMRVDSGGGGAKRGQVSALCRAGMALTVLAWFGCSEDTPSPVAPTPVTQSPGVGGTTGSPETDAQFAGLGLGESPVVGFQEVAGASGTAQANHDSAGGAGDGSTGLKAEAPTPREPTGGAEITDSTPVLTASIAQGLFVEATFEHEFALYKVAGSGRTQVEVGFGVSGANSTTSYQVTRDLDLGSRYVWQARAFLRTEAVPDGAYGPWSDDASFETAAIVLGVPTPLAPKDATVGVDTAFSVRNPTVKGNVTGAVRIEIQVATDAAFRANVMTGRANAGGGGRTDVPLAGSLQPSTAYHWRARAKATAAGAGEVTSAWSDSVRFTTSAITLTPPLPLSPRNGATGVQITTCPTRMFTVRDATVRGSQGQVSIQLEVALDQAFRNVVAEFETHQRGRGETNLCIDVALERGTQYYWRVRAQLAGSTLVSDWSAWWRFTTAEQRSRPTTAPPQGNCCPPPNRFEVVQAVVGATGNLYRQDIQQFTERVAECLAAEDGDWGRRLNASGAVGKDTVAYRTNKGPGHGPFSIDIMLGAAGTDPRPHWSIPRHDGVDGRIGGTWFAVDGANCILP